MSADRTISRRTVAKGAAWAVPVIAVGAPVPAMAASGCVTGTVTAAESRFGGDEITVTNTGPGLIPAGTVVQFDVQNVSADAATFYPEDRRGVAYTSGSRPLARDETGSFGLLVLADVPVGGSVGWTFFLIGSGPTSWKSSTYIAPTVGCGVIQGCTSNLDGEYGFDCPVTPLG